VAGHVEGQPERGSPSATWWGRRRFERIGNVDGDEDSNDRRGNVEAKEDIQEIRRQGNDQHHDDADDNDCYSDIGGLQFHEEIVSLSPHLELPLTARIPTAGLRRPLQTAFLQLEDVGKDLGHTFVELGRNGLADLAGPEQGPGQFRHSPR